MTKRIAVLFGALLFVLPACGATGKEKGEKQEAQTAQLALQEIADQINIEVQGAARRISMQTKEREVRRLMVRWQLHTLESCRRALLHKDLRWGFIDLWSLLYQTRQFVAQGEGKGILGPQEPIALKATANLLAFMKSRAGRILTPEQIEEVTGVLEQWASEHHASLGVAERPSEEGKASKVFSAIVSLPSDVFSIGGGVKDTGAAISEVAGAAGRGVDIMSSMPQVLRWQTELLIFSVEENKTITDLAENITKVSNAVVDIGKTARDLPQQLESGATRVIKEVESTQPEFQKTIKEVQVVTGDLETIADKATGTVKEVNKTLDKLQETGKWVEATAAHATDAGKAWEGALKQVYLITNPPRDPDVPLPPPQTEPPPPLDFKDVARTAENATLTAREVRATAVELRAMLEGDALDQRISHAEQATGSLVVKLTWCGAILILVFFGALLGYRVAAARLVESRG